MATRRATKVYENIEAFIADYQENLSQNMLPLTGDSYRGDLADNVKIDLKFPDNSRIGPLEGQVVFRGENRNVALRIMDMPEDVKNYFDAVYVDESKELAEQVEALVAKGVAVSKEEHERVVADLQGQIDALRAELAKAIQQLEQASQAGPTIQRGFRIPNWKGMEPSIRGAMNRWMPFLVQAQGNAVTGVAVLNVEGIQRVALFKAGQIVAWRSNPTLEEETLGHLLVQGGQLQPEQLRQALMLLGESEIRLGQALEQLGFLTHGQVLAALHKQMEWVLNRVLNIQQGEFAFFAIATLPEIYPWNPVSPVSVLFQKLRQVGQKMDATQMSNIFAAVMGQNVVMNPMLKTLQTQIEWSRSEAEWMEFLSEPKSLRQFLQNARNLQGEAMAWVWALVQLQLLQFQAPQQQVHPIVLKMQEKLKQIQGGTHFDVLGLHWICSDADVETRYQYMMSEMNVHGNPNVPSALQQQIPVILNGIHQAYTELRDAEKRRTYRQRIIHQSDIEQAARMLGEQGKAALAQSNKRQAIQCFTKALELHPTDVSLVQGLRQASMR